MIEYVSAPLDLDSLRGGAGEDGEDSKAAARDEEEDEDTDMRPGLGGLGFKRAEVRASDWGVAIGGYGNQIQVRAAPRGGLGLGLGRGPSAGMGAAVNLAKCRAGLWDMQAVRRRELGRCGSRTSDAGAEAPIVGNLDINDRARDMAWRACGRQPPFMRAVIRKEAADWRRAGRLEGTAPPGSWGGMRRTSACGAGDMLGAGALWEGQQ